MSGFRCWEQKIKLISGTTEPEIYIFGSMGRRLSLFSQAVKTEDRSLENYFVFANGRLRPRLNENKNWEIDVALPENSIQWQDLVDVCEEVKKDYLGMEVGPHLTVQNEDGDLVTKRCGAMCAGGTLPLKTWKIEVGEQLPPIQSLAAEQLLSYFFMFGRMRSKDWPEFA